jgi:hypothetical protein
MIILLINKLNYKKLYLLLLTFYYTKLYAKLNIKYT